MAQFDSVYIPYGGYWSTPFVRWQGNFSHLHSIRLAADVAQRALHERDMAPETFDVLFLGMTVIAEHSFYGAPWLAGLIGAAEISGPTINQACATSARVLASAAFEIETAENVAAESGISWEEQNAATLLRYQQYQDALKDNAAFHRRYMVTPLDVKDLSGRKVLATVTDDEGVYPSTAEGLSRLRPVKQGGTVSF